MSERKERDRDKRQINTDGERRRVDVIPYRNKEWSFHSGRETKHCSEVFISSGFEQDLVGRPSDRGAEGKGPREKENGMYGTDKRHGKGIQGRLTKHWKLQDLSQNPFNRVAAMSVPLSELSAFFNWKYVSMLILTVSTETAYSHFIAFNHLNTSVSTLRSQTKREGNILGES